MSHSEFPWVTRRTKRGILALVGYLLLSAIMLLASSCGQSPAVATPRVPPPATVTHVAADVTVEATIPTPPNQYPATATSHISIPISTPPSVETGTTGIPVGIKMSIDRAPLVSESATIHWSASSEWDMPLVHAFLELPEGVQVVSGTASWQGSLSAGGHQELAATVQVMSPGVWDIRAVVRTEPEGGDSWSNVAHLYLTAGLTESKIGLPSDDGKAGTEPVP
jgi:hypothetical protein